MSIPLPKMPLRGVMLLSVILILSGCSAPEDHRSPTRYYRVPPRPVSVQVPTSEPALIVEREQAPPDDAPKAQRLQPAKVKKALHVDAVEQLPAKVAPPVLDNSLPDQIYQPATIRQTSLDLKS
ncbi:MAG: hypothetical protein RSE29_02660 [Leclercia sp.]